MILWMVILVSEPCMRPTYLCCDDHIPSIRFDQVIKQGQNGDGSWDSHYPVSKAIYLHDPSTKSR